MTVIGGLSAQPAAYPPIHLTSEVNSLRYELEVCPSCGEFSELDDTTGFCAGCTGEQRTQLEIYLAKHADHIEHYLLKGCSLNDALDLVRLANQRTCPHCGGVIERAGPNAVFCRKTKECRQAVRRYTYLYERKGYSKSQALAVILGQTEGSE